MAEEIHKVQGYIPKPGTNEKNKFYFITAADLVKLTKSIPYIQPSSNNVHLALTDITNRIGDIAALETTNKNNLIVAINEALKKVNDGGNASKLNGKVSGDFVPFNQTTSRIGGTFDRIAGYPSSTDRIVYNGYLYGTRIYGAYYNDYAEFRQCDKELKAGTVVIENTENDCVKESNERMGILPKVVSDTFGMIIGLNEENSVPLAVSGRVLVYLDCPREEVKVGDVLCSGLCGKASKMTREEIKEYPDRMLGVVCSIPNYETWGDPCVQVDGRVWVEIK